MPKAPKSTKVPVTERALLQRINRALTEKNEIVKKSRPRSDGRGGTVYDSNLGEFYLIDTHRNALVAAHLDLEKLGREIGVLDGWEALEG